MGGRRTYERQSREIAEAHGGVPASGSPSRLDGGRPRLVEREVRRALLARGVS